MYSARWNTNPEVVWILIEAGADARVSDLFGSLAIDYARENEHLQGTDAYWRLHDTSFD